MGISKDGARKSESKVQRDRKLFLVLSQSLKVELCKDGICYLGKSELAIAKHRATSHLAGYHKGRFHLLMENRPDVACSLSATLAVMGSSEILRNFQEQNSYH